ncbi:MAG: oligopeptide/dipeptide ABC transporter ATP-binding protein [Chloroflexota bacterium]
MAGPDPAVPLLEVRDLRKQYERTKGWLRRVQGIVRAVDGVSFDVRQGETLALVGESGCGKTTTGRCIVRGIEPTSGEILFDDDGRRRDLVTMDPKELALARQKIRMIFQDPFASLNSRMTVLQIIGEPLLINGRARGKADLMEQVVALLRQVQLDPRYVGRYPNAFSGGQRQRIAIARALALDPRLVIADEPVSALDVSVQAQILNLMKELQQEKGLTYLFVAHNLAVVRYQSDRIAVMYLGRIVELSTREEVFERPLHPYTEMLLLSSPTPDPRARRRSVVVTGDVPDPAKRPAGCAFNPRCRFAQAICRTEEPPLVEVASGDGVSHQVACHLWDRITLEAD